MKKVRLIFGSTNSQAVGITDEEFEQVYQRSYKPYLRALYNASEVPVTLHFSGHLLQWLERHHSEYTDVLSEMVSRKQCELLGGGFYDPVLTLIPRLDRLGQIENMTTYIRKRFGRRPRGAWITEHVWEPSLASTLKSSGIEYAFLDDHHFVAAGLHGEDLCRPCITEDQGKTIVVFPVCHEMRSISRHGTPEEVIAYLKKHRNADDSQVLSLIDRGEQYGDDETVDRPAMRNVWLGQFVELLQENRDWIDIVLPATIVKEPRARARAYFHTASYKDIVGGNGNGATAENGDRIVGHFRQFLAQYAESNQMYAKMQYTHVLVNQIRGDKYRKQAAREELWRGQCHNAYWNSHRGGIFRNRLRKQVYHALIEAEKKTRERGIFIPSIVKIDFDMDGLEEYLYQGQDLNAYVHQCGGVMFELDHLQTCWNYLDTLARRMPRQSPGTAPQEGYDRYSRQAFLDHFLTRELSLAEFSSGTYEQLGSFVAQNYVPVRVKRDSHVIAFEVEGVVHAGGAECLVGLHKQYRFKRGIVEVDYTVELLAGEQLAVCFAPELNFAFLSSEGDVLRLLWRAAEGELSEMSEESVELPATQELRMEDLHNGTALNVQLDRDIPVWTMPVRTVHHVDGEERSEYQSTSVIPRFLLELKPGESFSTCVRLKLEKL
jgi:4-alpha-glucanotransferase